MPRKQSEYEDQLEGFAVSETYIECSKCKKGEGGLGIDEQELEEECWNKGWRVHNEDIYCPKCYKKIFKK